MILKIASRSATTSVLEKYRRVEGLRPERGRERQEVFRLILRSRNPKEGDKTRGKRAVKLGIKKIGQKRNLHNFLQQLRSEGGLEGALGKV